MPAWNVAKSYGSQGRLGRGDVPAAVPMPTAGRHTPSLLRACGLQLDALRNEPQLLKQTLNRERNLKSCVSGFRYRIRRATLELARDAEGLRGNEAT